MSILNLHIPDEEPHILPTAPDITSLNGAGADAQRNHTERKPRTAFGSSRSASRQIAEIEVDENAVLAAAQQTAYEVIFMDSQVPGIDGYEATHQIRKMEEGWEQRAWIVGDRARCVEAGMDDYVSKPVRQEDISGVENADWVGAVEIEALNGFRDLEDGNGQNVLADLVRIFSSNTVEVIESAYAALQSGNLAALAREAHMLKGSCSNFGANRMIAACERLEDAAHAGDAQTAQEALGKVEREYELVRIALEKEVGI